MAANAPASGPPNASLAAPGDTRTAESERASRTKGRRTLLMLVAVCIAPVIASYLAFYFAPPEGRTNYGDLIEPQRDLRQVPVSVISGSTPAAARAGQDPASAAVPSADGGSSGSLARWRGRWLMVSASGGRCDEACATRLYKMRQVRLTQGKNRHRIERLWLLTDAVAPDARIVSGYGVDGDEGFTIARIDANRLAQWFPAAPGDAVTDHIYLIDPLGNLMMRYPADADPGRMKKDLGRLLKASRIG